MTDAERIGKIEGQLTRVRWINHLLIVCVILSLGLQFILKAFTPETTWAKSGAKEIQASQFVVKDENGRTCIFLGMLD